MQEIKNWSLKRKILVVTGVYILFCMFIVIGSAVGTTLNMQEDSALEFVEAETKMQADTIGNSIEIQDQNLATLALEFNDHISRNTLIDIVKGQMEVATDATATYIVLNKNSLGLDENYIGDSRFTTDGRFAVKISRAADGTVEVNPTYAFNEESATASEYELYSMPMETGKPYLIEPFMENGIMQIASSHPLELDGQTVGVIARTIDFDKVLKDFKEVTLFETGKYMLVGNDGLIYYSAIPEFNGKNIGDLQQERYKEATVAALKSGESYIVESINPINNQKVIYSSSGLEIGEYAPWNVCVIPPVSEVTASGIETMYLLIVIGIISTIVLLLVFITSVEMFVIKPFNRLSKNVNDSKENLYKMARKILKTGEVLTAGSENQAASIEEISASIEESTSMIENTAEGTRNSVSLNKEAIDTAEEGTSKMKSMLESVGQIKSSSDEIGNIISAIQNISFQTNILALNAAVEAARAGEAGKGFSTVAEEVKSLATKSSEASKNTNTIIQNNIKLAEKGVKIATGVSESIEKIKDSIVSVSLITAKEAEAASEEATSMEQISSTIKIIETSVTETTTTAQSAAEISQTLMEKVSKLEDTVNKMNKELYGKGGK